MLPAFALWTAIAPATGASATIDLEWDAPSECPDREAVRAEIEQLAIGERRGVIAIGVVTPRDGDRWHLDLEIDTADGRQHFEWDALACGSLARGAALAIVAAADATAVAVPAPPLVEPTPPDDQESPPVEAAPAIADAPARAPTSSGAAAPVRAPKPVHGWLRLHAAAGVAQLPGFDGRLGLGGGVGWKWLRAEAIAAVTLPREERSLAIAVGARMFAFDVAARVGASTSGRFSVGGMVGTEIGAVRATGLGVESSQTAGDLWIAATFGPVIAVPVARRFGFFAGIDGVVALRRPRFAIRERADASEGEIVFRPRPGGVRVWLGFGVRFGG